MNFLWFYLTTSTENEQQNIFLSYLFRAFTHGLLGKKVANLGEMSILQVFTLNQTDEKLSGLILIEVPINSSQSSQSFHL